jgi:hypothetical protein
MNDRLLPFHIFFHSIMPPGNPPPNGSPSASPLPRLGDLFNRPLEARGLKGWDFFGAELRCIVMLTHDWSDDVNTCNNLRCRRIAR